MIEVTPAQAGSQETTRIGLALGGGSARGFAHIGVLQVLEEHGIRPALLAGTSFGALVAALYAAGLTVEEIEATAKAVRGRDLLRRIPDFGLHKAAVFEGRRLEAYFEHMIDGRHFEDLELPLVVATTDVDTGERVVLNSGPLAPALRASSSLPGIFAPVELGGRRLADGGLGASVPLDVLYDHDVDLRIGVGAGLTVRGSAAPEAVRRMASSRFGSMMCDRVLASRNGNAFVGLGKALAVGARGLGVVERADGALEMETAPPIHWLQFGRAAQAIRAGREAAAQFLPQLRGAIARFETAV